MDEFVTENELDELMIAADIYLAPYTSNQTTSGTVAQAVVNGLPVIANSFQYAQEVLADGSGILIDFADNQQVVLAIIKILEDQTFVSNVHKLSEDKAILWAWDRVWRQYYSIINLLSSNKKK
jgi:glycosyltransferase involved in cell wall biosynthesis